MEPNRYAHMSQPNVCYKKNGTSFDTSKPVECYCKKDVTQLNKSLKSTKRALKTLENKRRKDKSREDYDGQHDEIRHNIEKLQESIRNTKICIKSAKKGGSKERYSVKKKRSLSKTAIILLSVGGAILLGGIVALIIVLVKRKGKHKPPTPTKEI